MRVGESYIRPSIAILCMHDSISKEIILRDFKNTERIINFKQRFFLKSASR